MPKRGEKAFTQFGVRLLDPRQLFRDLRRETLKQVGAAHDADDALSAHDGNSLDPLRLSLRCDVRNRGVLRDGHDIVRHDVSGRKPVRLPVFAGFLLVVGENIEQPGVRVSLPIQF